MANRQQPNAAEKRWLKSISEFIENEGLGILYGIEFEGRSDFQLHHVVGRTAKHNKIEIGHWFVIPVPWELHDVDSNNPDNVTHFKHNFTKRFGEQCGIFQILVSVMDKWNDFNCNYEIPSKEIYTAIMDTRK